MIFKKKNLQLTKKQKLKYIKLKYFNYQMLFEYKSCIKSNKYKLWKVFKEYNRSIKYIKNQKYDASTSYKKNVSI